MEREGEEEVDRSKGYLCLLAAEARSARDESSDVYGVDSVDEKTPPPGRASDAFVCL
jgi:hypothetical protein